MSVKVDAFNKFLINFVVTCRLQVLQQKILIIKFGIVVQRCACQVLLQYLYLC